MQDFFEKNKIFLAIIIGALIIGGAIYFSGQEKKQSNEWILYTQSAPYQPFYKTSGLSLTQCQELGAEWLQEPSIVEGEYHCCRNCKLPFEVSEFLECGECYGYGENGFIAHDKLLIPLREIRSGE